MWLFVTVASALVFGFAGWLMKVSQMRGGSINAMLLGLYCTGSLGFIIQTWLEGSLPLTSDWRYWVAGIVIGAGSTWGNAVFMQALRYGPASLTSPVSNLNIVLIIAFSTLFYGETLSSTEGAGIVLLLAAVVLISVRRAEKLSIKEKKWFIFAGSAVLLFTFRNGGLKVTQELGMPGAPVLLIGYVLSFFWFAGVIWAERRRGRFPQSAPLSLAATPEAQDDSANIGKPARIAAVSVETAERTAAGYGETVERTAAGHGEPAESIPAAQDERGTQEKRPAVAADPFRTGLSLGLLVGLFSYGGLQLYSEALEMGKANLTAPIFATNSLVVAAGSIIVYRERLTRLQWAAFVCLLAGIVVIRL